MCPTCGAPYLPGALLCVCGNAITPPANAPAPAPAPMPDPAPVPAWSPPPPIALAVATPPRGRALKLVNGTTQFALPGDDFPELLLGRHDLDSRPPTVVDIDLGPLAPPQRGGYAFSRRQARLARRAGRLYLTALGAAQTLHRRSGADFAPLTPNQELELEPGDRLCFGSGDRALVLELE